MTTNPKGFELAREIRALLREEQIRRATIAHKRWERDNK